MTSNVCIVEKERNLLEIVLREQPQNTLEVGSGEGENMINLRQMGYENHFTGIDIDGDKVSFGAGYSPQGTYFACADAAALPFKDNSFDLVFCKNLLHHIILNQNTRALKRCGGSVRRVARS